MGHLTLLACQVEIPDTRSDGERARHVGALISRIDRHLTERKADIVVLPELSSVEYSRTAFDRLPEIAEPLNGASSRSFAGLAARHGTHVVFGMPRRDGNEYFISMVAVGPEGNLVGHYDKLHIAQFGASMEKEYFQRGKHLFVFEINSFRIAPIVCYDIRMPELTRTLCQDHGVHLILHCGAYARDESFYSWHHFAVTRAMENQCFLASINRAGDFFGESIMCSPWVNEDRPPVIFGTGEEFRYIELGMEELDSVRASYPFIPDKRDDYRSLPVQAP